jgi:hypothetical protein
VQQRKQQQSELLLPAKVFLSRSPDSQSQDIWSTSRPYRSLQLLLQCAPTLRHRRQHHLPIRLQLRRRVTSHGPLTRAAVASSFSCSFVSSSVDHSITRGRGRIRQSSRASQVSSSPRLRVSPVVAAISIGGVFPRTQRRLSSPERVPSYSARGWAVFTPCITFLIIFILSHHDTIGNHSPYHVSNVLSRRKFPTMESCGSPGSPAGCPELILGSPEFRHTKSPAKSQHWGSPRLGRSGRGPMWLELVAAQVRK